jgi:hypothetical protein
MDSLEWFQRYDERSLPTSRLLAVSTAGARLSNFIRPVHGGDLRWLSRRRLYRRPFNTEGSNSRNRRFRSTIASWRRATHVAQRGVLPTKREAIDRPGTFEAPA